MQDGESRRSEKLVALAVAAALVMNYPILHLFGDFSMTLGVPRLYLYLFVVWAVVIVCIAWVMRLDKPDRDR